MLEFVQPDIWIGYTYGMDYDLDSIWFVFGKIVICKNF